MLPHFILLQPARIFNTWLGDPSKVLLIGEVVKVIHEDNLLDNVKVTGDYLLTGLKELQVLLFLRRFLWANF